MLTVAIQEANDLEVEVELAKVLQPIRWGQTTVNELKELNLIKKEDPRPIYVRTMLMLTPAEEKKYFNLLFE